MGVRDREGRKRPPRLSIPPLSVVVALLAISAWLLPVSASKPAAPDLSGFPWLYVRGGEPVAAGEQVVEVIAVGDVMLGRDVVGEPRPFAAVSPWVRTADLVVGNLECTIAAGGTPRPGPYRLRAPVSAVTELRAAGLDLLGLANNHALDYGPEGLAETISWLERAGIDPIGADLDAGATSQPLIREVGGLRLAFLAFNAVPDPEDGIQDGGWGPARWDRAGSAAAIAAARAQADVVIVSIHWGNEYELRPDPAQRDMAQAILGAGADLVIGHHPHVVQGTELKLGGSSEESGVVGGRFVAYSLGNFVFDQQQGETRQGLALRALFDAQGLRAVQALPVRAGPRPRLMSSEEAAPLLARVRPAAPRIGFACEEEGCRQVEILQKAAEGPFRAGAIDLTGDGVPEQVRLAEGQVAVRRDGTEVWRGLPEWQVADLALGDPNDDGRGEILLALWKRDAEGEMRSHPFIVGYRAGAYRVLWGGSAVVDPILEVELGDVDGDGVEELIVLEEMAAGRAVSVWRWHGWGFSLVWRSLPDRYQDLGVVQVDVGQPSVITIAGLP
jgi:poly-gamma-glutamate capsule biosynthesis protein CapA/YwtB (metallophosphatase superfamily)